jgi:hypothetical protein
MKLLSVIILGFILGMTIKFNYYKLEWIYYLYKSGIPYKIFPWSYKGQVSSSPYWWLMIHPITGIALQLSTIIRMKFENPMINEIHTFLHYLFSGLVLMNIWNFGESPAIVAILLQGTLLLIMKWRMKGWIYFFALSSAPILEIVLFIRNWMV